MTEKTKALLSMVISLIALGICVKGIITWYHGKSPTTELAYVAGWFTGYLQAMLEK